MTQADSVHSTPPINTPTESSADSAEALYFPTDISPEELFQAIGRLRKEARDEVHRLIQFLDTTDDYVSRELEDAVDDVACDAPDEGNDEPSLGWTEQEARRGSHAWSGFIDAELDRCNDEPALAAPERGAQDSQEQWAAGVRDDREGDPGCDDLEPDVDAEPSEDDEPGLAWNDEEAARGRYPSQMGTTS